MIISFIFNIKFVAFIFCIYYNIFDRHSLNNILKGGFMKITDVRIRLVKKEEGKLKAVASITIDDCFVIHDIKILEGNEGCFVAMPSRKTPDGEYKDIAHPIKSETREEIIGMILTAYNNALKEE